jgi:hypothetical protein
LKVSLIDPFPGKSPALTTAPVALKIAPAAVAFWTVPASASAPSKSTAVELNFLFMRISKK